jgi:hypothetical protein
VISDLCIYLTSVLELYQMQIYYVIILHCSAVFLAKGNLQLAFLPGHICLLVPVSVFAREFWEKM